jgi:DNA-binding beta-propeller fold protein YncE
MKSLSKLRPKIGLIAVTVAIALVSGFFGSEATLRSESSIDGLSRLIAVDQLPDTNGAMCELPAHLSSGPTLSPALAALAQQAASNRAAADAARRAEVAKRKPLRTIQDQYALFSAVAVDAVRNEAVLTDENLFTIHVYDRTTNTPPAAALSEPKRLIGGPATHLELNCGVYIDPKTGNIYAVNNDTEDHLVVFNREAKGNVPPTWKLHTPHGAFGIAVDEEADELLLTSQHSNAVTAFRKTAKDDDHPLWLLQGDRTLLADPHGMAIDSKNKLLFVANFGSTATPRADKGGYIQYNRTRFQPGSKQFWPLDPGQMVPGSGRNLPPSITVYDKRTARGDAAPLRVITGPRTQLNWPAGLFVDSDRGELYVANDGGGSVLVFSVMANGDAAPIRVLKGPNTQLAYPSSVFVDTTNDELWVANFGNHSATIYRRTASGDTAPIRVIRSAPTGTPAPALANARIAYDTKREEILAPN